MKANIDDHRDVFEDSSVVTDYSNVSYLMRPEETILEYFENDWKRFRMLDIGVGGGRTVPSFANRVKEYHGVDFSVSMIETCQHRFGRMLDNAHFSVADARNMAMFPDGYFDFILFSFNGIDTMKYDDRSLVLKEANRVCSSDGHFFFSTHSIYTLNDMFRFDVSWLSELSIGKIRNAFRLRKMNPGWRRFPSATHMQIIDGAHDFRVAVCYVKPESQVEELIRCGFSDIHIYSLVTGKEITLSDSAKIADPWLYYLCRVRK